MGSAYTANPTHPQPVPAEGGGDMLHDSFASALRSFLLAQWERAPSTRRGYEAAVTCFAATYPDLALDVARRTHVEHFFAIKSRWSQGTRLLRWKGLRAFFEWCAAERITPTDAMDGMPRPKAPPARQPPFYSPEDFEALANACRGHLWMGRRDLALLWTLWTTPARVGELCSMMVGDIDFEGEMITFRNTKGKGVYRAVLWAPTAQAIDRYLRARPVDATFVWLSKDRVPLTPHAVRLILRRLAEQARLSKPIYPHALRHNFGMNTVRWGLGVDEAARIMGHRTTKATEIYRQWLLEDQALAKVRRIAG